MEKMEIVMNEDTDAAKEHEREAREEEEHKRSKRKISKPRYLKDYATK